MSAPKMTEKDVRNMFLSETTSFIKAVGGVEGLCLRKQSRPGGAPSYSWILRYDSGRKICSLGTASLNGNSGSGINLREARRLAQIALGRVSQGMSPTENASHRRKSRLQTTPSVQTSVKELVPLWLKHLRQTNWYAERKDYANHEQRFRDYVLPIIGSKKPAEVSAKDIARILNPLRQSAPAVAHKTQSGLNLFFGWCTANEYFPLSSQLPTSNAILRVLLSKQKPEQNYPALYWKEIPDFFAEIVAHRIHSVGALALMFCILTGSRSGNIGRGAHDERGKYCKWEDINLETRVWTIPKEKMKIKNSDHEVPLSEQAIAILMLLRQFDMTGTTGAVFRSVKGGSISSITLNSVIDKMHKASVQAGGKGWVDHKTKARATTHGTSRATLTTWVMESGYQLGHTKDTVERVLHHQIDKNYGTAYDRAHRLEPKRRLLQDWADFCFSKCPPNWPELAVA